MLRNYVVTAFRTMLNNKVHAFINISGLAIGITGIIFIALWIRYEWSFDRFHDKSDRTYRVMMNYSPTDGEVQTLSQAPVAIGRNILDQLTGVDAMTRVISIDRWPGTLCFKRDIKTDACYYRDGVFSDANFFSTFSYPIVAGAKEPFSDRNNIAISRRMAEALFSSLDPIGKAIMIDNRFEMKVTAVFENVPSNSSHQFDFVLSFPMFHTLRGIEEDSDYWREYPAETFIVAGEELDSAAFNLAINQPNVRTADFENAGASFFVQPLAHKRLYDHFVNGKVEGGRITYVKIFGIVGMVVILIACINYVNLATSRAMTRGREIGVRKVNGANRGALMLQFLGESFVSAATAMLIAVGMVQMLLPLFNALIGVPLTFHLLTFPMPVILLLILVVVTLASGIYPAFVMAGFNPVRAMKNKVGSGGGLNILRKSLTVTQLTASCILIIFTAVLFMQLSMIRKKHLGYDRENILRIEPTYHLLTKWEEFRTALLGSAEITNASVSMGDLLDVPLTTDKVSWPGKDETEITPFKVLACHYDFIETFGIEVLEGRAFSREHTGEITKVILTEAAVKRMGLERPIGARIRLYNSEAEVVGVARDVNSQSLHHDIEPTVFALTKAPERLTAIYVKYEGETPRAFETIRKVYDQFEPDFSMVYWFFDESFDKQYKTEAITSRLAVVFTFLAIGISILGVIGLSTYNILRRMREIGIRKVFGASVAQVVGLLSGDFIRLVALSSLLAWPLGAWFSEQWLHDFAFRISVPWYTYAAATGAILLLTFVAIGIQSVRAAMTSPSRTLKDE